MINWRSIAELGPPLEDKKYLVTDGKDISTTDVKLNCDYRGGPPIVTFKGWRGDDNTFEDNSCCSGTVMFAMEPTHWCPIEELTLPEVK